MFISTLKIIWLIGRTYMEVSTPMTLPLPRRRSSILKLEY
jgi:hypothetical protein